MRSTEISRWLLATLFATMLAIPSQIQAQNGCCLTYDQLSGRRTYRLYPYTYSYGHRHDPYWSYSSSYFPYGYQNDGSYYGLGYSSGLWYW